MPNTKLEDGEGYRVDSVADELDKRFIDREDLEKEGYIKVNDTYGYSERLEKDAIHKYKEELKDKINKIDIWNKNGLKVKKEILELLK